jgi:hypothetical protein
MTPSINRMIKLLSDEEKHYVDKLKVIMLEGEILKAFNFDFNFLSPLPFLERFLRLAELHTDRNVTHIAIELLKLQASQINFLEFKPSLVAAAALVLALNLTSDST